MPVKLCSLALVAWWALWSVNELIGYFLSDSIPFSIVHTWQDFQRGFFHYTHYLITDVVLDQCSCLKKNRETQKGHYGFDSYAPVRCVGFVFSSASVLNRALKIFVLQIYLLKMGWRPTSNLLYRFVCLFIVILQFFLQAPNEQAANYIYFSN